RYPLVVERAKRHALELRFLPHGAVPDSMIVIPGGPFRAREGRSMRTVVKRLPDFAIARFPMTFLQYIAFWESLCDPSEGARRLPESHGEPIFQKVDGHYRIRDSHVEGDARLRVPRERELDLPITDVTWYDACFYARRAASRTGLSLR